MVRLQTALQHIPVAFDAHVKQCHGNYALHIEGFLWSTLQMLHQPGWTAMLLDLLSCTCAKLSSKFTPLAPLTAIIMPLDTSYLKCASR